jgi:hypothetical protein
MDEKSPAELSKEPQQGMGDLPQKGMSQEPPAKERTEIGKKAGGNKTKKRKIKK